MFRKREKEREEGWFWFFSTIKRDGEDLLWYSNAVLEWWKMGGRMKGRKGLRMGRGLHKSSNEKGRRASGDINRKREREGKKRD